MLLDDMKLVCKTSRQNELASSVLRCVSLKLMDMEKVEGARWRMVVKKMREVCEERINTRRGGRASAVSTKVRRLGVESTAVLSLQLC